MAINPTEKRSIDRSLRYPWVRRWVIQGGKINLSDSGFLTDPAEHRFANPDVASWNEIAEKQCLILLGEPGIGKSTAIEVTGLTVSTPRRLYLNLRGHSDLRHLDSQFFGSRAFSEWLNTRETLEVVLDSLDECLVHIKTLAAWLVDNLQKYPRNNLSLRIVSRTAEWPHLLTEELPRLWNSEEIGFYELAPLSRNDVHVAAQAQQLDGEAFIRAVESAGAVSFAINPTTLNFLLEEFLQSQELSNDPVKLYEKGCLYLCREHNLSRIASGAVPTLPDLQIRSIAERIAAVTMFCRRGSIYVGLNPEEARSEEIDRTILGAGVDLIDGSPVELTPAMVGETLDTALFSGRQARRLGFSHWTYAEFLAARFCQTRKLSIDQISDLIFHPDSGERPQIVPQLAESAAWMAAMNPEVLQLIAQNDPQVLLRSSVIRMGEETRALIVSKLLQLFDGGKLIDADEGFRQRYDVLNHPKLDQQLEPYIRDKNKNVVVRRVAIGIAENCKLTSLGSLLADLALDKTEEGHIRDRASYGVVRIGDSKTQDRLWPFLVGQADDSHDQLKGNAMKALWPQKLSASEVFGFLTPPKRDNYFGAYCAFIEYDLPATLRREDLAVALDWVINNAAVARLDRFHRLGNAILKLAWQYLEDAQIKERFLSIVLERIEQHQPIFFRTYGKEEDTSKILVNEPHKRRVLLRLIVQRISTESTPRLYGVIDNKLVSSDDLPWLIDALKTGSTQSERKLWAIFIHTVMKWDSANQLNLVLRAREESTELAEQLRWDLNPVSLDSPEADEMRRNFQRVEGERQKFQRMNVVTHPSMSEMVKKHLDDFESGNTGAWWKLHLTLTLKSDSDYYQDQFELESDLRQFPGWKEIDDDLKVRCISAAKMYLEEADPKTEEWLGTSTLHRPSLAGYRGMRLILDEDAEGLDNLSPSVWARWTVVILTFPESIGVSETQRPELARRAYSIARNEFKSALQFVINKEKTAQTGHLFVLQLLDKTWDDELVDWFAAMLVGDTGLTAPSISDICQKIIPRAQPRVIDAITKLISKHWGDQHGRKKAVAAAVEFMNAKPNEAWDVVWPIFQTEEEFGKDVVTGLSMHFEQRHGQKIGVELSEDAIAQLYVWISERFPSKSDPQHTGIHAMGERELIGEFRDGLLTQLTRRGTQRAVSAIRKIADETGQVWLNFMAVTADRNRLRQDWNGVLPEQVFGLVRDRHVRIVENASQLLDVLIDSLRRLEKKLHGETSRVVALWDGNKPKDEKDFSDYIKTHIEDDLTEFGVLAAREAEVKRGKETDIYVAAVAQNALSGRNERIIVVVEAKGCWHPKLKNSMETQLKKRYLVHGGEGLYLIGWFVCEKWKASGDRRYKQTPKMGLHEAREFFDKQAVEISGSGVAIKAFVLNAARS